MLAERLPPAPGAPAKEHDALYKVIALGTAGVGKSSLLERHTTGKFSGNLQATIGVDFKRACFVVARTPQHRTACLQLWDTSGQEVYRAVVPQYYRGAHAILVVFDLTKEESFADVDKWVAEVQRFHEQQQQARPAQVIVVGNKSDERGRRAVSADVALAYCQARNFHYTETSAKTGDNVEQLFAHIATVLYAHDNAAAQAHTQASARRETKDALHSSRIVDLTQTRAELGLGLDAKKQAGGPCSCGT